MGYREERSDGLGLDFVFGLVFGLLGGAIAGIVFAPKPGKELQDDIQKFVNHLPEELNTRISSDKVRKIVETSRNRIEDQLEQRTMRKKAIRMAEAKRREEEASNYEY